MREAFKAHKFNQEGEGVLEDVTRVLDEYSALGFDLTLRQLYYQMIARDLFPESYRDPLTGSKNNEHSYKRMGTLVNNGRLAGLIDWSMISDRGRGTVWGSHWDSPGQIIRAAAEQFRIDKWESQLNHVEVMVEKQALEGVLIPVCQAEDVRFSANKGYSSSSTMYATAKRMARQLSQGKRVHVLYLGDLDPSGVDMTRDVEERLQQFSRSRQNLHVHRLALNVDQVLTWNPPPNPAKESDARYASFRAEYGDECWELDAIEPRELASLVREAVRGLRDETLWGVAVRQERRMRDELLEFADRYESSDEGEDEDEGYDEGAED